MFLLGCLAFLAYMMSICNYSLGVLEYSWRIGALQHSTPVLVLASASAFEVAAVLHWYSYWQ